MGGHSSAIFVDGNSTLFLHYYLINLDTVLVQEEELEEDPERLGLHVDDRVNVPEEDGRIQV